MKNVRLWSILGIILFTSQRSLATGYLSFASCSFEERPEVKARLLIDYDDNSASIRPAMLTVDGPINGFERSVTYAFTGQAVVDSAARTITVTLENEADSFLSNLVIGLKEKQSTTVKLVGNLEMACTFDEVEEFKF